MLSDTAMKLKKPSGRRTLAVLSGATIQRIPRRRALPRYSVKRAHLVRALYAMAVPISVVLVAAYCSAGCKNQVLRDLAAPDGRRHAVVFARDCGATTDFSTHVSVLPAGRAASGGGNVFVADADHGRAPAGPGGGPDVVVRWLDSHTLEVHYDHRARVFTRSARHDDIDVRFVPR